jgi:hypothetical protein
MSAMRILFLLLTLTSATAQDFEQSRAGSIVPPAAPVLSVPEPAVPGLGLVSYRDGLLARHPGGSADWLDAPLRSHVQEGDRVRTGETGRAEIEFTARNTLRLAPSTTLRLDVLAQEEQDAALRVDLDLERGELWAELEGLDGEDEFRVGSRVLGAAITGTGLRLAVDKDNETVLSVLHGEVHVAGSRAALDEGRPRLDVDSLSSLLATPRRERRPAGAPRPVAGPVPVQGPHEVSLDEWMVIVKSRQEIRIGADGRVRAAGRLDTAAHEEWLRWQQEKQTQPRR